MSGYNGTPVQTRSLWTWSAPVSGQAQQVISFPTIAGCPTKSGIQRADLEDYMQVTIQRNTIPATPISDAVVTKWIRFAEDDIETQTNVRLCQTWIAAPAAKTLPEVSALNLSVQHNYQQPGIDFDYEEAGYDFDFARWRDDGWGYIRLRSRPVKSISSFDPTGFVSTNAVAMKNAAFIYPLLNEFFRIPSTWTVEDQNRGLIRFVPATSVQMLPLFAMQLAFMGFSDSVPQGLWFQYTAGLTAADYQSDWSFMRELVLAMTAITAFQAMQTSINLGALEIMTTGDGLSQRIRYSEKGPFFGQISEQKDKVKGLLKRAKSKGGGFAMGTL